MALPRTPFWYLRHGQTDHNATGLAQGQIDIPLNETGRAQAQAAAQGLVGQGITAIAASPLRRALQTAQIVNQTLNLPLAIEPDLREAAYGSMEGQPMLPWFFDWVAGDATPEGAESFDELTVRVSGVLENLLRQPGPLLIVAHGALFRAIRALMDLPREAGIPNGQPIHCTPSGETGWELAMPHAD